jgi:lysozyme
MAITRRQFLAATPVAALGAATVTGLAQSGGWLKGIDVSHWQGTINWNSVRNAGTVFCVCKASEGTDYRDPTFLTNWNGMKAAGIIRGAYHMGRPAVDPVAQADYFINYVRPIKGDLQLMLDFERNDGKTKAQVWAWCQAFVNRIKMKTGRPPLIYTGFYFWKDSAGSPTNNLGCPLWLAAYTSSATPYIPPAWSTWTFWQYSSTGNIPGISGNVDRDYFNGSLTQLKALTFAG